MPHGESWFSFLPFHDRVLAWAHALGWPFNDEGLTWIAHGPIGVQHVYGAILVLMGLAVIGVITETSIRNGKDDLAPPAKFTLRNFCELFVGGTYSMMSDVMGKKAARYFLPLIGTAAFFILLSNTLGLVPGFLPPTSSLNTTLACGLVIFLATHVYGVKEHGIAYFKHFLGPIIHPAALLLMLLMLFIELISHAVRPASLGIRLMANMTADHMVLDIFLDLIPWWLPIPLLMYMLGTIVVIVQTLVFCLLSTVYIAMAIQHSDH
jgi:F-type H+-transporting ATPase subunit a